MKHHEKSGWRFILRNHHYKNHHFNHHFNHIDIIKHYVSHHIQPLGWKRPPSSQPASGRLWAGDSLPGSLSVPRQKMGTGLKEKELEMPGFDQTDAIFSTIFPLGTNSRIWWYLMFFGDECVWNNGDHECKANWWQDLAEGDAPEVFLWLLFGEQSCLDETLL